MVLEFSIFVKYCLFSVIGIIIDWKNDFWYNKTYSIGGEDFAGSYPSVTTVYEPHWEIKNMGYTAIKVRKMLYDITDN